MTTESTIDTTNLLGEVVTWDLRAAEVSYTRVVDALKDAGLDPDEAKEMTPRSAFGRACKWLRDERAIDKLQYDKTTGAAQFQFTRRHLAGGKYEYDYECVLSLDCNTGAVSCPENPALEQHARELLQHSIATRNAQDVTRLVQRLFQEHADLYPINPRKGVAYFVPEQHRSFTEKVDAFLHAMGGSLSRFPVPKGTPQGNASVKDAVQSGLQSLLNELGDAVEGWDETTRKSTMDKALERWQAIRHKVECYEEYLGAEQERLKEELSRAKEELARRITELKPDESEAESNSGAESEQLTSV